jgi:hypothetical protein
VVQSFERHKRIAVFHMMNFSKIAAGTAIAGALGLAALGIGTGVANAAPSPVGSGIQWAQDSGWGHGGPGWNGGGGGWNGGGRDGGYGGYGGYGGGWAPPPPAYGYGGYGGDYANGGGGCVTGPLGLLHFCT